MSIDAPIVEAIARLRAFARNGASRAVEIAAPMLLEIAVIAAGRVGQRDGTSLGQSEEASQPGWRHGTSGPRLADLWITPKDAASRLGRSERWLRRRRWSPPYSAFCIPSDTGRGFRVSEKGLAAHMERAASERIRER